MNSSIKRNQINFLQGKGNKIQNYYSIGRNGKKFDFKFEAPLIQKKDPKKWCFNRYMQMFEKQGEQWEYINSFKIDDWYSSEEFNPKEYEKFINNRSEFQIADIETHFDVTRDRILEKYSENFWSELLNQIERRQEAEKIVDTMDKTNGIKVKMDEVKVKLTSEVTIEKFKTKFRYETDLRVNDDKLSFGEYTDIYSFDNKQQNWTKDPVDNFNNNSVLKKITIDTRLESGEIQEVWQKQVQGNLKHQIESHLEEIYKSNQRQTQKPQVQKPPVMKM